MLPVNLTNEDLIEIEREYCQRSMSHFVKRAWPHIIPDKFQHNWHIDAVCDHLQAVSTGEITRLLINVPPGTSKSTLCGVMFPAWQWGAGGNPGFRYIGAAHEQGLAVRDNRLCRELVASRWFQRLWPLKLMGDQNEKIYFENEHRGFRQACAVASMTGRRGHAVVWDDPLNPEKANSEVSRETALRVFRETLPTRLNDPTSSAIIIVMQRLHEDDPSGYILANDLGYEHLMIPMEYEPERHCSTSIGWEDPRKKAGELLDPIRFPPEVIARDKAAMGSLTWARQMQQRPTPVEGNIYKLTWFQRYSVMPEGEYYTIHSWDTAYKKGTHNDPSVCTVWKVSKKNNVAYLIDVVCERMEYPELLKKINELAARDNPRSILIEDKASGQSLIQDIKLGSRQPVIAIRPEGDKLTRAIASSNAVESERIYLPEDAPWLADYLNELMAFPNAKHDDRVDSTSQFINWWKEKAKLDDYTELLRRMAK